MRAKFVILILVIIAAGFANFWNANHIVRETQKLARLEIKYAAEKNINTELRVERDELRSGNQFAGLLNFGPDGRPLQASQGKVIYIHEPADTQDTHG